jgi:hypothetical protein
MVELRDFIPAQHRVSIPVNGAEQDVDVRGLSLQDISGLIARHPEVIQAFDGKFDVAAILRLGPQVIATIIAMACGAPNDEAAERAVLALPLGTQAEILTIVVRETAPKGVGPFVALMKALGLDLNTVRNAAAASGNPSAKPSISSAAPDTSSAK